MTTTNRDFLSGQVVASVVPQDEFSGFAPLMPQVLTDRTNLKVQNPG